uniref:Uncharacterized protein n=1 Tax=Arundo donax TaxID=35708 RepID=A0A0A8XW12_ARUDO
MWISLCALVCLRLLFVAQMSVLFIIMHDVLQME